MSSPLVFVQGTHGLKNEWWVPHGPLWTSAARAGYRPLDPSDPFIWSTDLAGVFPDHHEAWVIGGKTLRWYVQAKAALPVSILAHSHGGQVALYAARLGLQIASLATVGTPVRRDLLSVAQAARPNVGKWTHFYSDVDPWQVAGSDFYPEESRGLERPESWVPPREFSLADRNVMYPGLGHTELLEATLWESEGWWALIRPES